ncbi:hypothetical protein Nepgr_002648 [Nepenthes gracilis]|uniref:Uncharacterized protein n=1 Tax=Nepenthes gracilis TaxID=150966 RepID=A0AAD3P6P1_NEPGR|nr:hypothetical protein Nepgr_002648 [Nepenthes gracilis]
MARCCSLPIRFDSHQVELHCAASLNAAVQKRLFSGEGAKPTELMSGLFSACDVGSSTVNLWLSGDIVSAIKVAIAADLRAGELLILLVVDKPLKKVLFCWVMVHMLKDVAVGLLDAAAGPGNRTLLLLIANAVDVCGLGFV